MRFASPLAGILILILLVAIPVGGIPALQKGSTATYNLTVEVSFASPMCQMTSPTSLQPTVIACPMIATPLLGTNITGTLGWTVTSLSTSAAMLNVTRDVTISSDGLMIPDHHSVSSFNESIDLASRIITIMPFLRTEMDNALQLDQSTGTALLPTGMDPNMAMNSVETSMPKFDPVYTMWWMNETLHQGQIVPVLVFPTKVVGAGSFEFQGKQRSTWALQFNKTLPSMQPEVSSSSPTWLGDGLSAVLTFDYDQVGGLLLSAAADVHIGFIEPLPQPVSCDTSANNSPTSCISPNSSMVFTRLSGFSIHASLSLASTSLNLDNTLSSSSSGGTTGGSGPGSGPGGNTGGGTGTGPGGNSGSSGGGSGGSSSGGSGGSGSGPSGGSGPGAGGSNSGGTPSSSSPQPPAGLAPWIYLAIATLIVAIIAAGLWIARRQSRKDSSQSSSGQATR